MANQHGGPSGQSGLECDHVSSRVALGFRRGPTQCGLQIQGRDCPFTWPRRGGQKGMTPSPRNTHPCTLGRCTPDYIPTPILA